MVISGPSLLRLQELYAGGNPEPVIRIVFVALPRLGKHLIDLLTISLPVHVERPLDSATNVTVLGVFGDFLVTLLRGRIPAEKRLADRQPGRLVEVDLRHAVIRVDNLDDFNRPVREHVGAFRLEDQPSLMEARAQYVKRIAQRGFLVAGKAIGGQRARPAERQLVGFILQKEDAALLLLAVILTFFYRQRMSGILHQVAVAR